MAQSVRATPARLPLGALLRLGRLKEHMVFSLPTTWVGVLVAQPVLNEAKGLLLLAAITLANVLAVTYAFMINDIADAPDDAMHPESAQRNPISRGDIPMGLAWTASYAIALVSALLYVLVAFVQGSWGVLVFGLLTVLLSDLYSRRSVRLKKWPIIDVVSHVLMLGGLLVLNGHYAFTTQLNEGGLIIFLAATIGSTYGQLYNQVRDYDTDKDEAGLHNTTILIGKGPAQVIQIAAGLGLLALLALAWNRQLFPVWMPFVALGIFVVLALVYRPGKDMSGKQAVDPSGGFQQHFWVAVNIAVLAWLVVEILTQFGLLGG